MAGERGSFRGFRRVWNEAGRRLGRRDRVERMDRDQPAKKTPSLDSVIRSLEKLTSRRKGLSERPYAAGGASAKAHRRLKNREARASRKRNRPRKKTKR